MAYIREGWSPARFRRTPDQIMTRRWRQTELVEHLGVGPYGRGAGCSCRRLVGQETLDLGDLASVTPRIVMSRTGPRARQPDGGRLGVVRVGEQLRGMGPTA